MCGPPLTCFRSMCPQSSPAPHHFTRLARRPELACRHIDTNPTLAQRKQHRITPARGYKSAHHVRSHPSHHRSLPRAILPPDRPHPRQSPPTTRRAGNDRCWWSDQRFLEPRKSLQLNHLNGSSFYKCSRTQLELLLTLCDHRTHTSSSTTPWRSSAKCRTI